VTTSPPSAGLFRDHPIPPVQVKDPLALLDEIRSQPDTTSDSARPHIGFA